MELDRLVIGVMVVKRLRQPSGSLTEHIETSKSTAGGLGGLQGEPAGTSSLTKALLKRPARLELIQHNTKLKDGLKT